MAERWCETCVDHNYYDGSDWRKSCLLAHEILLQTGQITTDDTGEATISTRWDFRDIDDINFCIELSEQALQESYATYRLAITNFDQPTQEVIFTFSSRPEGIKNIQIGSDIEALRIDQYESEYDMIQKFLMTGAIDSRKFDRKKFVDRIENEQRFWRIVGSHSLDIFADQEAMHRLAAKSSELRHSVQKETILKDVIGYRGIDPSIIRRALDDHLDELHMTIHSTQNTLRPIFSDDPPEEKY